MPTEAEKSDIVFEYLLEKIEQSRLTMHASFKRIPDADLAACPADDGKSIGDTVWEIVRSFNVFLSAMCDGQFEDPAPAKPSPAAIQAFLAWDEAKSPATLRRVKKLSGDALTQTVPLGTLRIPVKDIPYFFLSSMSLNLGGLAVHLQSLEKKQNASTEEQNNGALSEADLDLVCGGAGTSIPIAPGTPVAPGLGKNAPVTYVWGPGSYIPPSQCDTLGALFITSSPKINSIMGDVAGAFLAFLPIGSFGTGVGLKVAEELETAAQNALIKAGELR